MTAGGGRNRLAVYSVARMETELDLYFFFAYHDAQQPRL